jgi:hypothetical protein
MEPCPVAGIREVHTSYFSTGAMPPAPGRLIDISNDV